MFLSITQAKEWGLLGWILLLLGALTVAGGILILTEGSVIGFLIVTLLCLIGSVLTKSGLLAALSVLSLSSTVGAMTAYGEATYMLTIRQPMVTIFLFSLLAFAAYRLSKALSLDYQRLSIIIARTSVFVVNLGFWVGSLWGDSLWYQTDTWSFRSGVVIPDWVFVIGWAVGLVSTGVWAARENKRWIVNLLTVFGAIHFYTQYFERLGATPSAILFAGILALGIAIATYRYNKAALSEVVKTPRQESQAE